MFTWATKYLDVVNKHLLKSRYLRLLSVSWFGAQARLNFSQIHAPLAWRISQRLYSAPAWHKPLGSVPMPRKDRAQTKSVDIVPVEDIVNRRSLVCLENIHDACSASEVFRALGEFHADLSEIHIARALSKLAEIHNQASAPHTLDWDDDRKNAHVAKGTETETRSLSLRFEREFVNLCHLTLLHAKTMDSGAFLDVVKAVLDLGVPHNSVMVQTLLACAEQRLNHFSCDELAKFASRLARLDQTDQRVRALMQAIALLVPDRIDSCINAASLIVLLRTVGGQLHRRTHAQMAVRLIAIFSAKQEMARDETVLDTANAVITFYSVRYHNEQFLKEACQILRQGVECLAPAKLMLALHSLSGLRYYSPELLDESGEWVANSIDDISPYQLSRVLSTYSSQRYLHEKLLNSVANALSSKNLHHESFATLTRILSPFAKFQHDPQVGNGALIFDLIADAAERRLDSCPDSELDGSQLVYLVALLAMCGSFSPRLVKKALSRSCYEPALTDSKTLPHLRTLHNIITLDRPRRVAAEGQSLDARDSEELSRALDQLERETCDTPMKPGDKFKVAVGKILRDETENSRYSLALDVIIRNGYSADFVLSDQKEEQASIAFDLTRHIHYCANFPDRPLARATLKRRHLAAMGYKFHMIRRTDLRVLDSDEERAKYIRQVLGLFP